ncbi:MAG TPA: PIG-L family deacetylase [Acidimicrobiales bacterium]|nr:PIG-L family deacetylase [Acidimicrobiales bacterium]
MIVRTPTHAAALGTVLGVWAHPDDETYLSSGLMALARRAGNRVVCVTATRGEHGTDDPVRWPPERLARTRDHEIAAAMAVLGVAEHRFLAFEDGTLAAVDPARGATLVGELLAEVRPDTILSFGSDGMTGHPDHRAIAGWVAAACRRARDAGARIRLVQATTTARFAAEFADLHERFSVFGPGLPLRTADDDLAVRVDLDDELQDLKLAALRAQATQTGPLLAAVGEDRYRTWWREEAFVAAPVPAANHPVRPLVTTGAHR